MSSNLPPEELAAAGRSSLWRRFKMVLEAVIGGLAALALAAIQHADARTHFLLADPKRKRKRQMFATLSALS